MTDLEAAFLYLCRVHGLPEPEYQVAIPGVKRKRWDWGWTPKRIVIELQGATWVPGKGHSGGTGLRRDCEKLNQATAAGWRQFAATTDMVREGCTELMDVLKRELL